MNTKKHKTLLQKFLTKLLCLFLMFTCVVQTGSLYGLENNTTTDEESYPYMVSIVRIGNGTGDDFRCDYLLKDENDNLYLSQKTIEAYTGYHLDMESRKDEWLLQKYEKKIAVSYSKQIRISYEKKTASLRTYTVDLPGLPVYMGEVWLPIAQIVPMLDTLLYVNDGNLVMDQNGVSALDALHNLAIDDLYFDPATEFKGKSWKEYIQVYGSNFLQKFTDFSIVDLTPQGNVEAYETVLTDYMTDRDAYEKALTYGPNTYANTQKAVKKINKLYGLSIDSLKVIQSFAEWVDRADPMKKGSMLKAFYESVPEDVFEGMKELKRGVKAVTIATDYVCNAALMVKDNFDMIKVVYPEAVSKKLPYKRDSEQYSKGKWFLDKMISEAQYTYRVKTKYTAAREMYAKYEDLDMWQFMDNWIQDLTEEILKDTVDKFIIETALGLDPIISSLAKLAGTVVTEFLKSVGVQAVDDLARLNHHIIVEHDALEAYKYYVSHIGEQYTWEEIENTRLSAIMTLLASKKCFEIIRDNNAFREEIVSYCESRIKEIEDALIPLYLARLGVLLDGIKFFEAETDHLSKELKNVRTEEIDPMTEVFGSWARQNLPEIQQNDYMYLADVTGDGQSDLIVTHYGDTGLKDGIRYDDYLFNKEDYLSTGFNPFKEGVFMQIYAFVNGSVRLIYECPADFSHIGWTYQILTPYEDGYAILNILDVEYQGYKSGGYELYRPVVNENKELVAGEYWIPGDTQPLRSSGWDGDEVPKEEQEFLTNAQNNGTVILNTQYQDRPLGTSTYESWFLFCEIHSDEEIEEDPTIEDSEGDQSSQEWDGNQEGVYQNLKEGLWITTIDDSYTYWLTFSGTGNDLTMNFGVTEWNVDYSCPVTLHTTDDPMKFVIDDQQAISKRLPEFYQTGYTLTLDLYSGNIYLDLGFVNLLFENIG